MIQGGKRLKGVNPLVNIELPLVTVVSISSSCGPDVLERTIKSVIRQDYPNLEYVIPDNGSQDGSVEVLKKYSDSISYWISEPDPGLYRAMNKGYGLSTGEWICFMNVGDEFPESNSVISDMVKLIRGTNKKLVYSDVIMVNPQFRYLRKYSENLADNMLKGILRLNHQAMFAHRSLFEKIGIFEQNRFKIAADTYWYNKVLHEFGAGVFQYAPFVMAHFYEDGISSKPESFTTMFNEDVQIIRDFKRGKLNETLFYLDYVKRKFLAQLLYSFFRTGRIYKLYRKIKFTGSEKVQEVS